MVVDTPHVILDNSGSVTDSSLRLFVTRRIRRHRFRATAVARVTHDLRLFFLRLPQSPPSLPNTLLTSQLPQLPPVPPILIEPASGGVPMILAAIPHPPTHFARRSHPRARFWV